MVFQERDGLLLLALYTYEVLSRQHIKSMFWPRASWRAMEMRLSLLYHNGYINWPNEHQRRTQPIPEPVVWLGWRGAIWVAGHYGIDIESPTKNTEYQLRIFSRKLRHQGFRWLREPRWIQLTHDLWVVDFRMAVENGIAKNPTLSLEEWIPEGVWLSDHDVIEYGYKGRDGEIIRKKKGIRPDGYFSVVDQKRQIKGSAVRSRFLLEIDMSTHPNRRFGREKAAPGVAFIRSPEFKARFGYQSGRWLVVTTGEVRMRNLMRLTHQYTGSDAKVFFFTTFAHLVTENILTDPIWYQIGRDNPLSLFPNPT
jgi:hypothetical protein